MLVSTAYVKISEDGQGGEDGVSVQEKLHTPQLVDRLVMKSLLCGPNVLDAKTGQDKMRNPCKRTLPEPSWCWFLLLDHEVGLEDHFTG